MSVVANVAINVDSTAAERALKNLGNTTVALQRKFDALPSKLSAGLQGLGDKVKGLGQQLTGLGTVMAGIGASAAVGGFVRAGVEAERTGKTIKALADQHNETAKVTQFASKTAAQFGIGQTQAAKAVADLYGRLRPMGVSLSDIQKTFTGVNKAAALMNLTAADTDGVMLQLSQALGSGVLQGDEFRSIMERLPAIGQAIATTMGVPVSQLKQLSSEGKLTTDVVLRAMDELSKIQPPPPDAYKVFQAALADLNTTIGTELLPIFTPLVQKLSEIIARFKELGVGATVAQALKPLGDLALKLLEGFAGLPQPLQEAVIQFGALAIAFSLIAAPLGVFLQGFGAVVKILGTLSGLKIGAIIAGWAPVIMNVVGALGALGKILIGVFSGPVGWVALLVAAGVAIYAFRDQIGAAFSAIGDMLKWVAAGFKSIFIDPVIGLVKGFYDYNVMVFNKLADVLKAPFQAVANFIRGIINGIIGGVEGAINGAIGGINGLIRAANRALAVVRGPQIPLVSGVQLPRFAEGGVVKRPTLAMVGEGGEPEYIIPESKAAAFAANYLSGARGSSAVPSGTANVSIQTGPVTQMNGTNYVTTQDLSRAVQAGVQQTLNLLRNDIGVRGGLGIA